MTTLKEKVLKVVGKIDLDSVNMPTRPTKASKEERDALRQQKKEEAILYNRNLIEANLEQMINSKVIRYLL